MEPARVARCLYGGRLSKKTQTKCWNDIPSGILKPGRGSRMRWIARRWRGGGEGRLQTKTMQRRRGEGIERRRERNWDVQIKTLLLITTTHSPAFAATQPFLSNIPFSSSLIHDISSPPFPRPPVILNDFDSPLLQEYYSVPVSFFSDCESHLISTLCV